MAITAPERPTAPVSKDSAAPKADAGPASTRSQVDIAIQRGGPKEGLRFLARLNPFRKPGVKSADANLTGLPEAGGAVAGAAQNSTEQATGTNPGSPITANSSERAPRPRLTKQQKEEQTRKENEAAYLLGEKIGTDPQLWKSEAGRQEILDKSAGGEYKVFNSEGYQLGTRTISKVEMDAVVKAGLIPSSPGYKRFLKPDGSLNKDAYDQAVRETAKSIEAQRAQAPQPVTPEAQSQAEQVTPEVTALKTQLEQADNRIRALESRQEQSQEMFLKIMPQIEAMLKMLNEKAKNESAEKKAETNLFITILSILLNIGIGLGSVAVEGAKQAGPQVEQR